MSPLTRAVALLAVAMAAAAVGRAGAQATGPDDPLYHARGAWGQAHDDQWALKRIGFTRPGQGPSAWDLAAGATHPVIVAVIDTGLDYFHPDLRRESVWRNPSETPNGRDDDGNGYVDDLIGWNFVDGDNNPWDIAGHGTHVAGVIAAATGNREGIAGINPQARIMPLKVMNFVGRGRASGIAEAVFYAVRHGARIINLSLGGRQLSRTEQQAVEYAHRKGLLVVVAAGNLGADTVDYGPAGARGAFTVAATGLDDRPAGFSNFGQAVKLAAPGVDVLSLRARRTDFVLVTGVAGYRAGDSFVGPQARYYRASGTSFAAPLVAGVASLILSRSPGLTGTQVERMLMMSADDVEVPGWDQLTGAGRLNALRALAAAPDRYLLAKVRAIRPTREGGRTVIQVHGTAEGNDLASYTLELAKGTAPERWTPIGAEQAAPVADGLLGIIPLREITSRGTWTVRVVVRDRLGNQREGRGTLNVE